MSKQLCFDSEAREALKAGVSKLARAVKSTLGPRGRCAVIDRGWGGPNISKDGYTVADEIELKDPYENMGAQLVKEAANKTNDVSGDGTTTATVLAEGIFLAALRQIQAGSHTAGINRGLHKACADAVAALQKMAQKVSLDTPERLIEVATIAANNDPEVGKFLVDALQRVGKDGVISIEEGKGTETEVKVVEGMQFDRGYLSPHFVTDTKTLECEHKNALVLIHEEKISSIKPLIPLLERVSQANRPLVIIAEDVEGEALATLVVNKLRGVFNCVAVKAPGYGDRRKAMLQDIAILTGAKKPVFKDTGVDVEALTVADLGSAQRIVCTSDATTIVEGAGSEKDIQARVKQIRAEIENTDSSYDKEKLEERLAKLAGGVAQINVGAATETEMKEKKARIKDAQASVTAALEQGILPGGGVALLRVAQNLTPGADLSDEEAIGYRILARALSAPFHQIVENAGGHGAVAAQKVLAQKKQSFGLDVLTDTYGDLYECGVIDPCKVTVTALTNAVSVASILISTNCVITDLPKDDEDGDDMDMDMD